MPDLIIWVALRVPITHVYQIPGYYGWVRKGTAVSVTRPEILEKLTTQAGLVILQISMSSFWILSNSAGEVTNLAIPSTTPENRVYL